MVQLSNQDAKYCFLKVLSLFSGDKLMQITAALALLTAVFKGRRVFLALASPRAMGEGTGVRRWQHCPLWTKKTGRPDRKDWVAR